MCITQYALDSVSYTLKKKCIVNEMSKKKESIEEIIDNWKRQLRKGTLELAILSYIKKETGESYGYNLIKTFNETGIETDGSTIYPMLRRLTKKGLIEITEKPKEQKKYFKITNKGNQVLKDLLEEWSTYYANINHFIKNGGT